MSDNELKTITDKETNSTLSWRDVLLGLGAIVTAAYTGTAGFRHEGARS